MPVYACIQSPLGVLPAHEALNYCFLHAGLDWHKSGTTSVPGPIAILTKVELVLACAVMHLTDIAID